jgi:hypothetical protein
MSQSLLSYKEITYYTNMWCREKGIHSRDLMLHPQADDVVLLLKFREEYWLDMDHSEQGTWAAYWNWCYTNKHPLKNKHLAKLEIIWNSVEFKRHQQALRRAKIKALKSESKEQKTGHDMMDKGPVLDTGSPPWK